MSQILAAVPATLLISIAAIGCNEAVVPDTAPLQSPAPSQPETKTKTADAPRASTADVDAPAPDISLPEPTAENPVVARAALAPAKARPGETVTLVVRVKTAADWHIYAADRPTDLSIPTKLELDLPDGVVADREWDYPQADPFTSDSGPTFIYQGDLTFRRRLKIAPDTKAVAKNVICNFTYQACNLFSCLPPKKIRLQTEVEIVPTTNQE